MRGAVITAGLALWAWSGAGCSSASGGVAAENTAAACQNAADDDGDGHTGCADQDCWDFVFCAAQVSDTVGGDALSEDTGQPGDAAGGDTAMGGDADGTSLPDGGGGDTASGPSCEPCADGAVTGKVCAPSENVFVNDALVVIEGTGCDGLPFHLETRSAADGSWAFAAVPCGSHVVTVAKGSFERIFQVAVASGHTTDLSAAATKQCFQAAGTPIAGLDGTWDKIF